MPEAGVGGGEHGVVAEDQRRALPTPQELEAESRDLADFVGVGHRDQAVADQQAAIASEPSTRPK